MKDLDTMTQGERFSYESVDIEKLRQLQQLPEWLKQHKRARAIMKWRPVACPDHIPPGHPRQLLYRPENWRGDMQDVGVIPDPDNIAWGEVSYTRENGYRPEAGWEEKREQMARNRYYVVTSADCRRLWNPLSWNHLRMQVWEVSMYQWHHNQYRGHDGQAFTYPPGPLDSRVIRPKIDPHWKDEYIQEVLRAYHLEKEAEANEKEQYARLYALPEGHLAVLAIRKVFPSYQPREDLIADPKRDPAYQWIEPYRWFYRYATLEEMESDPIGALERK